MYFNRELSWLKFNERVLKEAADLSLPLLERLKYCAIFSSNLDEFFMVRVASIQEQMHAGYHEVDDSGYKPEEVYGQIHEDVNRLIQLQHHLTCQCLEALKEEAIELVHRKDFDASIMEELRYYFETEVFPVLTPMAVDFSRPFPFVRNKKLYIVCKLLIDNAYKLALVQVPSNMDRIVKFKLAGKDYFVLLEDIIMQFIDQLFIGHTIVDSSLFRITRNADLELIEDDADDLLMVIEEAVKKRQWGEPIRLEVSDTCDRWTLDLLRKIYHLKDNQIYKIQDILDMTLWLEMDVSKRKKHLKRVSYEPRIMPFMDPKRIFKTISEGDVFLHHPYESFDYVVDFIKLASKDKNVLAIKQTLYRVSGDSAIIQALAEAAELGKQVTVLVELMARFDEENNIEWAKMLEKRGVHVIYGIYGFKTHSKITLVVRKEKKRIKRYVHLSTGNYNDRTAKFYTDMGYLTCKEHFGADASLFFNMVFGFTNAVNSQYFSVAPYELRKDFYKLIDQEIDHVKNGHKGLIIAKMNALVDKGMVDKLYEASRAGVKVKLIVRGVCSLVPGLENLSHNIHVTSIVGEFLEHSRVYYFHNNHHPKVFLSSADWMTRNLNRRVELMFPIVDEVIAHRIKVTLDLYLKDNVKAWRLLSDGQYEKKHIKDKAICAHDILKHIDYDSHEGFVKAVKDSL